MARSSQLPGHRRASRAGSQARSGTRAAGRGAVVSRGVAGRARPLRARWSPGATNTTGAGPAAPGGDEPGFGGPQVCRIVGITYRQLDYWARTGLVVPSIEPAHGSGTRRRYAYRDLIALRVIKALLDAGVSLQRARRAIECLREGLGSDLASARLVLGSNGSLLARSDGELVDLLRGGQGVLSVLELGGVVDELDAAIVGLDGGAAGATDPRQQTRQLASAHAPAAP
jgi:DNA-binding transcriptional MerR regulator